MRETDREAMAGLDQDAILDLHQPIRRERDEYLWQYRRRACTRLTEVGGRPRRHVTGRPIAP